MTPWWREAVVYHIYVRSFADSDGDGVGDLEGIRRHLGHLGRGGLDVDAIWLSPIYPSPDRDFGYDVSDYRAVNPLFGDIAGFDALVADAADVGVRVVLDFVPNHTSTDHPWFRAARASLDDPHRDWYFFRDRGPDGAPPNNWASSFGKGAWRPDGTTGQVYLASFLAEQADLNWRNPELRGEMLESMRFWLRRGAAGFRLDVVDRIMKDPALRDDPAKPGMEAVAEIAPYIAQEHVHSANTPDLIDALATMRETVDAFDGDPFLVGECFPESAEQRRAYYGTPQRPGLHLSFDFNRSLADVNWNAGAFRNMLAMAAEELPDHAWPAWALSNHDRARHTTRFDPSGTAPERPKAAAVVLLTVRGTPFLYYGEEIGMRTVDIPPDEQLDPVSSAFPGFGRDGERTPMRWTADPATVGFTTGTPWLRTGGDVPGGDVAAQQGDPRSVLETYRRILALRRDRVSLRRGSITLVADGGPVLAYFREHDGERSGIAVNFGDEPAPLPPELSAAGLILDTWDPGASTLPAELAPDQAVVVDL